MNATRQTLPIRLFSLSSTAGLALGLALAVGSLKAAGELDTGFNPNVNNSVNSLVVQANGKVLIGGYFTTVGGAARQFLARLNADGSLNTGFNPSVDNSVSSLAVQADGKVLIGGYFGTVGGVARNGIARLNADGSLDTGFDPNGDYFVSSLAVQADGKVLIGGWFTNLKGERKGIARLNAGGSLDTGFLPNLNDMDYGPVYSLAVQADGKVLIGGGFTTVGGVARNGIARLNADGSLDTGFNPNANNSVYSLAVQADGKVLIGGWFTTVGGVARNYIARLNANGSIDTGFNPNANDSEGFSSVDSLAVQANGKVLIGGYSSTEGGVSRKGIARLNADGSLDTGFNPNAVLNLNAYGEVSSLAVQADGKVLIGGRFTTVGGVARNYIASLANDPATQSLTIPDPTRVLWSRAGSAPEVSDVVFEQSLDGGATWTLLGAGARIGVTADWELTGLSLGAGVNVRATGRTIGSSGLIRQVYPADPKPDLSIGADLTSRRGDPAFFFAKVANEGLLPDAIRLRGSSGDNFFAVSYSTAEGNVTAQVIAGSFATPVMGQDDPPVNLTVSVSPNKRLLTKKVRKGKRVLTTYLRKTHSGVIEATAAGDPTRSDAVRYRVTTMP